MIHQRKRFNYLAAHQRNTYTLSHADNEKKQLKPRCIMSSNVSSHSKNQLIIGSQFFSRNSSAQKFIQPLSQIQSNIPSLEQKSSTKRIFGICDKQNLTQSVSNSSYKKQKLSFSSKKQSPEQLHEKIRYLEQQNTEIIKQTEEKLLQMQSSFEKVEAILKQKQSMIQKLSEQNRILRSENIQNQEIRVQLKDEKQQLIRIIGEKNIEISTLNSEIEKFSQAYSSLQEKISLLNEQNQTLQDEKLIIQSRLNRVCAEIELQTQISIQNQQTQTQSQEFSQTSPQEISVSESLTCIQTSTFNQQTDLSYLQTEQFINQSQTQQPLNNLKLKYDSLFKRALQMEDQLYKLKEQLFDSQAETKTVKHQFNSYKLLHQLYKFNHNPDKSYPNQ